MSAQEQGGAVQSAELAADAVTLRVFFDGIVNPPTFGTVRDAALEVIRERDAAIRRAAFREAADLLLHEAQNTNAHSPVKSNLLRNARRIRALAASGPSASGGGAAREGEG